MEEPLSLPAWRTVNSNAMVAQVYESIKAVDENVAFGISPQGNIQNDENMGADVTTWAAVPGYVDYLAPQLYYSFENEALPYQQALEEWEALPRHPGLKLYAGLALYKAGTDADGGYLAQPGRHHRPAGGGGFAKRLPGGAAVLLGSFQQPAGRQGIGKRRGPAGAILTDSDLKWYNTKIERNRNPK